VCTPLQLHRIFCGTLPAFFPIPIHLCAFLSRHTLVFLSFLPFIHRLAAQSYADATFFFEHFFFAAPSGPPTPVPGTLSSIRLRARCHLFFSGHSELCFCEPAVCGCTPEVDPAFATPVTPISGLPCNGVGVFPLFSPACVCSLHRDFGMEFQPDAKSLVLLRNHWFFVPSLLWILNQALSRQPGVLLFCPTPGRHNPFSPSGLDVCVATPFSIFLCICPPRPTSPRGGSLSR